MKKGVLVIVGIALMFLSSCRISDKSETRGVNVSDIENHTEIEFEVLEKDLGKVSHGSINTMTFNYKNSGDAPLYIQSVKGSCGCTVPKGWENQVLNPGEEGSFDVNFKPNAGMNGPVLKTVSVLANTRPAKTILKFTAEVVGPK